MRGFLRTHPYTMDSSLKSAAPSTPVPAPKDKQAAPVPNLFVCFIMVAMASAFVVVIACSNKPSMEGTYYSVEDRDDTLVITKLEGNQYSLKSPSGKLVLMTGRRAGNVITGPVGWTVFTAEFTTDCRLVTLRAAADEFVYVRGQ
jgi:hypothetical protein